MNRKFSIAVLVLLIVGGCQTTGGLNVMKTPPSQPLANGNEIGVVLIHGSGDIAWRLDTLQSVLERQGAEVIVPKMVWAAGMKSWRHFNEVVDGIDKHVEALRGAGRTRIFIGGHSLGAMVANAYGSRRTGLGGIILMAPGAFPSIGGHAPSINKAQDMVRDGKGDEIADFRTPERRYTSSETVRTTARKYLSWHDPEDSPAIYHENAMALKAPLLYIAGDQDFAKVNQSTGAVFDWAPKSPLNEYWLIASTHQELPSDSDSVIVNWMNRIRK